MKIAKWKMVVSSVLVLLPGAVCSLMDGGFGGLIISIVLLAGHWLSIGITAKDPGNAQQSGKVLDMLLWIMPVLSALEAGIMHGAQRGLFIHPALFLNVMLGILCMVIGNYMPKTRRNATIGVKIKWTLENDENWNATHRFTGKVWMAAGIGFFAAAFLPEAAAVAAMMVLLAVMIAAPMGYSYGYYRRQLATGCYERQTITMKTVSKKWGIGIAVVILTAVAVLIFTGEIHYNFGEDSLRISATYYQDARIPYAEIEDTELLADFDGGYRTWGFASGRLAMGNFRSSALGDYIRYTYTGSKTAIRVQAGEETYLLSGKNEFETRMLYETLAGAINP